MKRTAIALLGLTVFGLLVAPSSVVGQHYPLPKDPPEKSPAPPTKFVRKKKPIPHHYIVVLDDEVAPANLSLEDRPKDFDGRPRDRRAKLL